MESNGDGLVALIIILLTFGVILFYKSLVVIDQREIGIVKILGQVQKDPLKPGVHLVSPIADIVRLPAYEMTMVEKHIKALTSEGLPVYLDIAVQYKIDPDRAPMLYSTLRNYEVWMENRIRAYIRDLISKSKAEDLYTGGMAKVQQVFEKKIREEFEPYGILVTAVLIRNIDLPESVEKAIQAKIEAKQEAERMKYIVLKEKLEAERKKVEAEGIAEANRIIGESLRRNPEYIQWYYLQVLQKFAESQNNAIIIVPVPADKFYPGVNITQPVMPMILPSK